MPTPKIGFWWKSEDKTGFLPKNKDLKQNFTQKQGVKSAINQNKKGVTKTK